MENMRFKVGDRVRIKSLDWYNENKTIHGDIWFDNAVFVGGQSLYCGCELTIRLVINDSYYVIENDYYWTDEMIEGVVEPELTAPTIMDGSIFLDKWFKIEQEIVCPEDYEFFDEMGNIIKTQRVFIRKKKKEYPKTFEECVHVLEGDSRMSLEQMNTFRRLIDSRNAYWKIAGEEMGLGKPWEPDWTDEHQVKYTIYTMGNDVIRHVGNYIHAILAFPTEEMRDAFKENFDPDIEICKEFL